jgi:hypothetical protein
MKNSEAQKLERYRVARVRARNLLRDDTARLKHRMQPESLMGEAAKSVGHATKTKSKAVVNWSKNHPWPLLGGTGGLLALTLGVVFRRKIARYAVRLAVKAKVKQVRQRMAVWLRTKGN